MLKYRLISAFVLIPVVIAALFLLPPAGFAIVTLVVCMLAAWEWGQFSGFTSTSQRIWLALLCGLLLALMLFLMPEYHYDVHQPLVEGSLWASFGWWIVALLLVLSGGLLGSRSPVALGWWVRLGILFGVGVAVLVAGLVVLGRDGKMLTYAALVLACASCQWLLLRGWR